MTPTPAAPDPSRRLRALDSVEPPEQWDRIVGLAAERSPALADAPGARTTRRTRGLVVAAALLVVVAIAAGLAASRSGDQGVAGDPPSALWGHRWQLVRVDAGDASIDQELTSAAGEPIVLDATVEGTLAIQVCNQMEMKATLDGDQLEIIEEFQTAAGCTDVLDQFVRFESTRVQVDGTTLVVEQTADLGARSTFERIDAGSFLPPLLWGHRWHVTGGSINGVELDVEPGSPVVIDARSEGMLVVNTCGGTSAAFALDGKQLTPAGGWQERMVRCAPSPKLLLATEVRDLLSGGVELTFTDGGRLQLTSTTGQVQAEPGPTSDPWELWGDPFDPFDPSTARWGVVEALEQAEPRDLVDRPVLTATIASEEPYRTVAISAGCASVGGKAEVDEDAGILVPLTPWTYEAQDCPDAAKSQSRWFEDLLADGPSVVVIGQRARISVPGRSILLIRLD
jgi:hypothetical protein